MAPRPEGKQKVSDLAIFGGKAAFAVPLHVGRPSLPRGQDLPPRIAGILERQWYTNDGPLVREFEDQIAAMLGVRHCVAMSNGTAALEVAIRALDLRGEVIVPSFTFIATAHALHWLGLTPVFCDVDPATHAMSAAEARLLITDQTSAVLPVHLWGRPADVAALGAMAAAADVRLFFDAAHAFGCNSGGRPIGGFGSLEVFSFHATKFVTTGEGGAVVTQDDGLAGHLRRLRNFGFSGYDTVISQGTNAKMSEFAAAVGLTSLAGMAETVAINRRNHELYQEALADLPQLRLVLYDERDGSNYQYVVLEVDGSYGITRDVVLAVLRAENVLARRYFFPGSHRMAPYAAMPPRRPLPVTERLAESVLTLPTGIATSEEAVRSVSDLLRFVLNHGAEIAERSGRLPRPD